MYDLYIGNKNYSSWSLRAWLLMKHFGLPFTEHMVSVAGRDYNATLKPLAGNARVPSLHDDGSRSGRASPLPNTWPSAIRRSGRPMPRRGRGHAASRPKCTPVSPSCARRCR